MLKRFLARALILMLVFIATVAPLSAQSWIPPFTAVTGVVVTAQQLNASYRDNLLVLRAGGFAVSSQTIGDLLCASSTTQFARLADVATGAVLISGGVGACPSYATAFTLSGSIAMSYFLTAAGQRNVIGGGLLGRSVTNPTNSLDIYDGTAPAGFGTGSFVTLYATAGELLSMDQAGTATALSYGDTLPTAVQGNITSVDTVTTGVWNAGAVTSSGLLTINGFGTNTFSAGANSHLDLHIINTTSGTLAEGQLRIAAGTNNLYIETFSQGFTTSGPSVQDGALIHVEGAGGLTLMASSAFGPVKFYSGGTTEAARIHASRGVSIGDATDPGATNLRVAGTSTLVGNVTMSGTANAVGTVTSGVWNAGAVTSSGLLTINGFGNHIFSATGAGENALYVRNLSTGAGALASMYIGNSGSGTAGGVLQTSTGYTPSNYLLADATVLYAERVGGLSIAAVHASGDVRIYSRNALAATFGASQAATFTGQITGNLTGNVTGNASGTAATVTGATQAAITSAANLVTVGTLTSGATGAGFTVALATSTMSGDLPDVNLSANVPLLNAANSFTAFGTHSFSASGTGGNNLVVRNTAAGTSNSASVLMGNDTTLAVMELAVTASNFTSSAPYLQDGGALVVSNAGGLSLSASHASGDVRIYSRNALAATFGASQGVALTGIITSASVGTAALRTATGSFADTNGGNHAMNDYSFFPNLETDDCTGMTNITVNFDTTNATNDEVGRLNTTVNPGACGAGSYDGRWRYVTASDNPDIWIEVEDATGKVTAMWQSEDPVEQPLQQDGHTATRLDVPSAADVKAMYTDLEPTLRQQARADFLAYLVSRGWAVEGMTVAEAIDQIPDRYRRAARMWAVRCIAKAAGVDPAELMFETMQQVNGRITPKASYAFVVQEYRTKRAERIAAKQAAREIEKAERMAGGGR